MDDATRSTDPGAPPDRRSGVPSRVGTLSDWKQLLKDEELRCVEVNTGAGIVSIGVEEPREDEDARMVIAIGSLLRPTDQVCVLRAGEIGLLITPLDGLQHLEKLAQACYDALHEEGVDASVGFAIRKLGHGLFHAAAQADAAMLRRRPGGLDLR